MKFFLALLLVASCQAFSIKSLFEKESFVSLIKHAVDGLEQLATVELEKALTGEGVTLTEAERTVIKKFSAEFGQTLRQELAQIINEVHSFAEFKAKFAEKVYEDLRVAAEDIASGIKKGPEVTKKFMKQLLSDIEQLEKQGHALIDINFGKLFEHVFDSTVATIVYSSHQKRDLTDIFGKINDTLRRIVGHLHGKFHDLHDFLGKAIDITKEKLHPHVENIKTLAKAFISHIGQVNARVAQQALEFFRPWATILGSTWTTLVNDIHQRLSNLNPTVTPEFY
ncbi:uncharacterized protein LOC115221193 [Argonauta hians]